MLIKLRLISLFFPLFFSGVPSIFISAQTIPDAPANSTNSPDTATNTLWLVSSAPNLKFLPGDGLKIRVPGDSGLFLNGIYPIYDEGCVDLPKIGVVKVLDKTPAQLEEWLASRYITLLPRMSITVRPVIRVGLLGGFLKPGLYWADPRENIWETMALAGGTLREDGICKIRWLRNGKPVCADITPYFQSGKSLSSIGFASGDQLIVTPQPKKEFWDIVTTHIVPIVTVTLGMVTASATLYLAYESYNNRR